MSMLSEQCNALRSEAERIGYWNPTASRLMFDAADILWSLRNKNVALLEENESLQAENDRLIVKLNAEHIHRQNVEAENDRLSQLCKDMLTALACEFAEKTHGWPDASWTWWDRAKECGIEVGQ